MSPSKRSAELAALASAPVLPLCWVMALQDQPMAVALTYLAYLLAVVAAPGTLLWRRLTGGTGWFAVDAVLGTAFGLALESLVYLVGRWIGVPLLPLLLPATALGLALGLPVLKPTGRPLPWWSVAGVMVSVGILATWYGRIGSRLIALDGPAALRPNGDAPFQLALAAELTHHFPPQVPYVAGEQLTYHWMAHSHLASAHWITGIELDALTHRVEPLMILLLTTLGVAAVAVVLSGRPVAAPIGAGLAVLAGDLSPWPWVFGSALHNDSPLSMGQLMSPTQAFAAVLTLPLIAVTALLLRRAPDRSHQRVVGLYAVALVLIAALAAAKATALPVYGAGIAGAWLYLSVRSRRVELRALTLGVLVAAAYATNFLLVLDGASHGMAVRPAGTFRAVLAGMASGLPGGVAVSPSIVAVVLIALALAWLMPAVGVFLIRRHLPGDPMPVLLLVGFLAGCVAAMMLWHFSYAQVFFIRSAFVYGILLAAWGLSSLNRRQLLTVTPALGLGAVAIHIGRARTPGLPGDCHDNACLRSVVTTPLLTTLALVAAGVLVLGVVLRARAGTWVALAVAAAIGLTVTPTPTSIQHVSGPTQLPWEAIAPGGIEAARFIRAHSDPNELIATNVHCQAPAARTCHRASFWIPAYAERRVLVQGWAYTDKANAGGTAKDALFGPFWDQEKLAINDAAFTAPTPADLDRLRTTYGVTWLLADERVGKVPPSLDRLATLQFKSGTVRVYRLTPPLVGRRPDVSG